MSQPAKKRKIHDQREELEELTNRKQEVKKYADKVKKGLEEGTFGDVDLLANCDDPFILKKKREKEFKILPLLYNGRPTGWGKCSPCTNVTKEKLFRISDSESGFKISHIRRHLLAWHSTDLERKTFEKKQVDQSKQTEISSFLSKRRLTPAQHAEMRRLNLEVTTSTNIPLGFFNKPAMKKRDEKLLEFCGFAPDDASKFDKSAETLKKEAFDQSKKNKEMIKSVARALAEEGQLALALDYKSILNQKGDEEPDALGIELILTLKKQRYNYLLDYKPSNKKDKETTVALAQETLKEYGLWELVQKGQVSFVCDAGLVTAVKKLAPNCHIEICHFHTVGRIQENTLGKNLELYDKRSTSKKKEMNSFIAFCKDGYSNDARKQLPNHTAKSINNWTFDHTLTEEDRLNMGKYMNPKGWKKIWNNEELPEEEISRRAVFLTKFKRLPVVKRPKLIRPRTLKPALDALLILKPHLVAAKDDDTHPLHEHMQQNSIDFDFVHAQHTIAELLEPFIDFFEKDDNHQIGEYFAVVTHLCKFAGTPQLNNSKYQRELQTHKVGFFYFLLTSRMKK